MKRRLVNYYLENISCSTHNISNLLMYIKVNGSIFYEWSAYICQYVTSIPTQQILTKSDIWLYTAPLKLFKPHWVLALISPLHS